MDIAIKINNKEEYLEAKEILIKKGFESDEPWNNFIINDIINDNSQHYLIIYNDNIFESHIHDGCCGIIYKDINKFLKDNESRKI